MPRGQSYSINPDASSIPWQATVGRRRTVDGGFESSGPLPTPDDYIMSLPDYGRQETQMDPYSQGIRRVRDYIGENYAKPYVGQFAKGAIEDNVLGDLLTGTPMPKDQTGSRTVGNIAQLAAMVPEGIWQGGKAALGGAVKSAEPAIAKLLGRGSEVAGTAAVEEMGRFGASPAMASIANDSGAARRFIAPHPDDARAAAGELGRMGMPQGRIDAIMPHIGAGTALDLQNLRNMGPTDEMMLLNRIAEKEARVMGGGSTGARIAGHTQTEALTPGGSQLIRRQAPAIIIPGRNAPPSASGLIVPPNAGQITQHGMSSINPHWLNSDVTPEIEQLMGAGYTNLGRPPGVHGASPKTFLRNQQGEDYMYKGLPGGAIPGDEESFASIQQSASKWGGPGLVNDEEAGTRLLRLMNKKTPLGVQVKEHGLITPVIHGQPPPIWKINPHGLPDDEQLAHQMMQEQVFDTLAQTGDRNEGQFLWDDATKTMWPVDKGLSDIRGYKAGPQRAYGSALTGSMPIADIGAYKPLGKSISMGSGRPNQTGVWNKYLDPKVGHEAIDVVESIPEADYREALKGLKRNGNMSDAEFNDMMRGFMGEIPSLRQRFSDFYRLNQP